LYFAELREPKHLLYLPNEQHSVNDYEPVVRTLRALHESSADGATLPQLEWEHQTAEGTLALCMRAAGNARRLRLWRAASADRDLRDARWQLASDARGSSARFLLREPAQGYVAFFGEAAFGTGVGAFTLSTTLVVSAAPAEIPYGTRPPGRDGLCTALESSTTVSVP
jgi:PhoPQ-activated pathogenicity-related protein